MRITSGSPVQRAISFPSSDDLSAIDRSGDVVRPVGPDDGDEEPQGIFSQSGDESDESNQSSPQNPESSEQDSDERSSRNSSSLPIVNRPPGLTMEQSGDNSSDQGSPIGESLIPDAVPGENSESSSGAAIQEGGEGEGKGPNELSSAEQRQVEKLKRIDAKVRAHEQAHLAAAGPHAQGGPSYEYTQGPDGRRYAVGGEVSLDTSKGDTPEETIQKMRTVRSAALAPAEPSSQDMSVANKATQKLNEARAEKQTQKREENQGEQSTGSEAPGENQSERTDNQRADENEGAGEVGEARPGENGPAPTTQQAEPFSEDGDDAEEPGGIEFFEDFGEIADSAGEPFQSNAPGEGRRNGRGDTENEIGDVTPTEERNGVQNLVENNGETESVDENSDNDGNDENGPGFLTAEAVRRERESITGQRLNLVI